MSGSVYRGPIMNISASILLVLDSTKLALCESRFLIIHIYLIVDTGVVHAMSGSSFSYPLPPLKSTFLFPSQGEGLKSSSLRHVLTDRAVCPRWPPLMTSSTLTVEKNKQTVECLHQSKA